MKIYKIFKNKENINMENPGNKAFKLMAGFISKVGIFSAVDQEDVIKKQVCKDFGISNKTAEMLFNNAIATRI